MSDDEKELEEKALQKLQEKLDYHPPLNIEEPRPWIILYCTFALLAALLLWSFLGKIPTEISGRSVTISASGVFLIESPSSGTVTQLYVSEQEVIQKGEPLAKINNLNLRSLLFGIEATKFKIERLRNQSSLLEDALATNISLYKKGLIAKLVIDKSRSDLMDKNIDVENARSSLSNLFAELEQNAFVNPQKFSYYKKLLSSPPDVINFNQILDELSTIFAPSDGTVLEVLVSEREIMQPNEPLFWVENPQIPGEVEVFYGTIKSQTQGQLRKGLRVLIEPATVNSREYGAIMGTVSTINPYPVSKQELKQTIGNEQIVGFLIEEDEIMSQITVIPIKDKNTASGFQWTSGEGPPYKIPTGTVCNMRIIIEEQPPISYLIPLWKIKPQ